MFSQCAAPWVSDGWVSGLWSKFGSKNGSGILIKYGSNTVTESAQQVSQLSTYCKVLARGLDRAMPNIRTSPRQVPYLVHACAAGPLAFWYEFANARSVASQVSAHQGDWRLLMINSNAICSTFCTPFKIHTKIHI